LIYPENAIKFVMKTIVKKPIAVIATTPFSFNPKENFLVFIKLILNDTDYKNESAFTH